MRSRLLAAAVGLALVAGLPGALALRPANRPPVAAVPARLRAVVGAAFEARLDASDPDGDELRWSATDLPPGVRLDAGGQLHWSPAADQAGTYAVEVVVTDADGAATRAAIELVARHPAHPDLYLAMGDSVASGHGLEWRDYLGGDPCWRDGADSYPAQFLAGQRATHGPPGPPLTTLALVACSGHRAADLLTAPVDGGPALKDQPGRMTQVAWAVAANPGLVTITVGANDVGVGHPGDAVGPGGVVDEGLVGARLTELQERLTAVLRRLADATDARIVVTTYHNPAAPDANGVPGCRRACFRAATAAVVADLNHTLRAVAGTIPPDRVAVAEVTAAFDGHEAPNGRGPDFLRDARSPLPVPALLGWTGDVHPYCADGHSLSRDPWISAVDCIHPNRAGARAYADATGTAWRTAAWAAPPA